MSGGARVPGSPRRGRRRGRSWSRSRSRSPRGRIVDDVERDRYRSRSRSRDGVHEDDRRDRAGPLGTSRDRSRDASARRERTTLTPTEPDEPDRTNRRSGFGLGYRPEEDGALRAAFGARNIKQTTNFSGPRPSASPPSRRAFRGGRLGGTPLFAETRIGERELSLFAHFRRLAREQRRARAARDDRRRRRNFAVGGVAARRAKRIDGEKRRWRFRKSARKKTGPPREVSRRSSCVVLFPSARRDP